MSEKKSNRRHSGRPTVSDVARFAQCSPMTVSRVINGHPSVRTEAREAVEAAIKALNYAPNRAARSLAGAGQIRIALLYTNPSAAYLSELLLGCLDEASRADVHLVVERCAFGEDEEKVVKRQMAGGIDGFLLPPPLCDEKALLDLLHGLKVRAVQIGPGQADPHHDAVMIDDYQAAYDMTRHIMALGHRRIGFIIGNPHQSASGLRLSGFRDAMAAGQLAVEEDLVRQGSFTYRSGFDGAAALLELAAPPTAIFASNDDMAAGCVAAAQRQHLEVPQDLTVCGFDDTAIATKIWPELTTVRQPIHAMACTALNLLVERIRAERGADRSAVQHKVLDYELVKRDSDAELLP
ncbi:LacI family DNA-binding transcriptional regulator [Novosphingobium terrae]|uniref:LacI family DNA-binding transcriptional regulator n=1 Tax=Novosphingobium terrae TaxID=2726189 RepID=UPI00197D406A|nr:LacI family DNA-binding transcriptional regulator [Novosphingobium terrae]